VLVAGIDDVGVDLVRHDDQIMANGEFSHLFEFSPGEGTAGRVLRMATHDGARALGLDSEIGSLEVRKRADVAVVRLDRLHATPVTDVVSALVYSAEQDDVDTVIIDGDLLLRERQLLRLNEREIIWDAQLQRKVLAADLR